MKQILLIQGLILFFVVSGCKKTYESDLRMATPDWTTETHSNDVPPDYQTVFPEDKVLRFDITISAADWASMQTDLTTNINISNP